MTDNKIIERIEREMGMAGLAEKLAGLSPTDLQSLLMEVYRQQAGKRQPAAVLADHEKNRFTRPSAVHPLTLAAWEQAAFAALPPDFEAISLSPVCALGTNSAVALVDQNRVMSTIYNTEVVSDSTNVMAMECALRRRDMLRQTPKAATPVHLAASHRLVRTQRYDNPTFLAHFSAFALCSSGRDQGNLQFELSTFVEHIGFYIRAFKAFLGDALPVRVMLTDFRPGGESPFAAALFAQLEQRFGDVEYVLDPNPDRDHAYYTDLRFHLYARNAEGQMLELVDGGAVNWTQKLLNNAKERCVISGVGSERLCTAFGKSQ